MSLLGESALPHKPTPGTPWRSRHRGLYPFDSEYLIRIEDYITFSRVPATDCERTYKTEDGRIYKTRVGQLL